MNIKKTIFPLLCLLLHCTSCGNFDINGDMDGMWHLCSVETLNDNHIKDVKYERIYYSVQQNLFRLKKHQVKEPSAFIGRFIHKNDSLILYNFVIFQNESIMATTEALEMFYLDGPTSRYAIETLNTNKMVLRSNTRELTFKKF